MKRYLLPAGTLVALFGLGVVLQSTVFAVWRFCGVQPDLVGVVVILVGMMKGPSFGGAVGVFGGFLQDLMTGRMLGLNLLSKAVAGWFAGIVKEQVFVRNMIVSALLVFIGSVLDQAVLAFVIRAFGEGVPFLYALVGVILPTAAYNSLLSLAIYPALVEIDKAIAEATRLGG